MSQELDFSRVLKARADDFKKELESAQAKFKESMQSMESAAEDLGSRSSQVRAALDKIAEAKSASEVTASIKAAAAELGKMQDGARLSAAEMRALDEVGRRAAESLRIELAQAWQEISNKQGIITHYKNLKSSLKDVGTEIAQTQQRMRLLEQSMSDSPTREQQKQYAALAKELTGLNGKKRELAGQLKLAQQSMGNAGVAVKNLAATEKVLAAESEAAKAKLQSLTEQAEQLKAVADAKITLGIDTDERARAEIDKVKQAYQTLQKSGSLSSAELARANELHTQKVRELESSLKTAKVPLSELVSEIGSLVTKAGGIAYATKEAMEFERAMAGVKKVVDGTPEQIEALGGQIKNLAFELGMVPEAVAEIAALGGQLGIPIEKLGQFTEIAGRMAVAFDISADAAGEAAAKLTNVFDLPLEAVELLGDAINTLGNNTAAKEKDIIEAMTRIGGNAKQFGLAAEQAAALADAMIALGRPPQVAATAINALLAKLQTAQVQGDKFNEGLKTIGLSADQMAADIAANPQQALNQFLKLLENLDKQSRSIALAQMFGAEYSDDIALLVGSLQEYDKALALVADKSRYAGAMQQEFSNVMDNAAARVRQAQIAIVNVTKELGATLLPIVSAVADGVGGAANAVAYLAQQYPQLTKFAMYLAAARVAAMAFGTATRLMGAEGVTATTAITAGAAKTTAALGLLRTSVAATAASTRGMTAAAAAQQIALAGWARAANGLASAMRLLAANPIGLVLTAAAAALTLFERKAGTTAGRIEEMEDAIDDANQALDKLQNRAREGILLSTEDIVSTLSAATDAADKSRDALLKLRMSIRGREESNTWLAKVETFIEKAKDFLPFFRSQKEKAKEVEEAYEKWAKKVAQLREEERLLEEQRKRDESHTRFAEQQQAAADAQQNISAASRQIITDLQNLALSASEITTEQVRGIDASVKNLSSGAAIAEAEAQIKRLAATSKITGQEAARLLDELKQRQQELGEVQVQSAKAAGGQIALTRDEVKALAESYKALGLAIPASFAGMTEADEKLVNALNNIKDKTGVTAEQMREMMGSAFAKIETRDGVVAIQQFFNEWAKQQNLTDVEMQRFLEQIVQKTEAAFGRLTQSSSQVADAFGKLGVSVDEVTQGIGAKAKQAFADFGAASAAMRENGVNDSRLLAAGFEQVFAQLKNRQEFAAFKKQLQASGDMAKLTQEQIKRLNDAAKEGAIVAASAYDILSKSIKDAADKASLSGVSAAAQKAMRAGEISATQYEQVLAQVDARTAELEKNTNQYGNAAKDAHDKAAKAAKEHEAAANKAADATKKQAESTKAVGNAHSATARQMTTANRITFAFFDKSIVHAEAQVKMYEYLRQAMKTMSTNVSEFFGQYNQAVMRYQNQVKKAQDATTNLNAKIEQGTVNQKDLAQAVNASHARFGELDKTTLGNLHSAIDKARQKIQALQDEAAATRASLEADLADLQGDAGKKADLEQQNKLRELGLKLAEAERAQNSAAAADYRRAMGLQQQIHTERQRQAAAEKARRQQEEREREAKAQESAKQAAVPPQVINIGAAEVPLQATSDAAAEIAGTLQEVLSGRDEQLTQQVLQKLVQELRNEIKRMGQ